MPTHLSRAVGRIALVAGLIAISLPTMAADNEFAAPLTELGNTILRNIADNPLLVAAVAAQNALTGLYDQQKIEALDQQWRAEVAAADRPLIEATLATAASRWLQEAQDASGGVFTEIFVMDARGLNVAQSTVTSDYWQGDEDKFTASYGAGAAAVHLGEIEQDESTQTFQSQVSITIVDPATGTPIGAITAGIDLSMI